MKEEWAVLKQWMKNHERMHTSDSNKVLKNFQTYTISQTEINNSHQQLISKIMHRIYGNAEDGIITDLKLNRQSSESEILRLDESLKRLWWAFGLIVIALLGNLVKNIFF